MGTKNSFRYTIGMFLLGIIWKIDRVSAYVAVAVIEWIARGPKPETTIEVDPDSNENPSVYFRDSSDQSGYYGLHNYGPDSWINAYSDDGKFVASVSRCFDYHGTIEGLKTDPQVTIFTPEKYNE